MQKVRSSGSDRNHSPELRIGKVAQQGIRDPFAFGNVVEFILKPMEGLNDPRARFRPAQNRRRGATVLNWYLLILQLDWLEPRVYEDLNAGWPDLCQSEIVGRSHTVDDEPRMIATCDGLNDRVVGHRRGGVWHSVGPMVEPAVDALRTRSAATSLCSTLSMAGRAEIGEVS